MRIETEYKTLIDRPELAPPIIAQELLITAEDHRHRFHPGFDPIAICRALWKHFIFGSCEGGSTIEQQLVRTITGKYERTLKRKLREIILATLVDAYFRKEIIPAVYLSVAYYGWRMNGYVQACRRLRLRTSLLTMHEAASLVARLKYPEPKTIPLNRITQIQRRTKYILALYPRHLRNGNYEHLNGETLCCRRPTLKTAQSVSQF